MKIGYAILLVTVLFFGACQKKDTVALLLTKNTAKADTVLQSQLPAFVPAIDTFYGIITGGGVDMVPDSIDSPAYLYVDYYAPDTIRFLSDHQEYVDVYMPGYYNTYFGLDMDFVTDSSNLYFGEYSFTGEESYSFRFVHDSLYYHAVYNDASTYVFYEISIAGRRISTHR